jgi:hypothetical protein
VLSVLLLTAILATIFMRVLKHDFVKFSEDDGGDDDESGWKFIHGDVFRIPPCTNLFCALIGAGTQLLCLVGCVFSLALVGVFYPHNRGLLYTAQVRSGVTTSDNCQRLASLIGAHIFLVSLLTSCDGGGVYRIVEHRAGVNKQ